MQRHKSLPRMPDIKRSWHGASHNFRESMRSLGSGSLRSSFRDSTRSRNSVQESPKSTKKKIGDSFKRTGDVLRKSTGNLRDSMRNKSSSFRDGLNRSGNSLRNSFRRGERRGQGGEVEEQPASANGMATM